MVYDQEKGSQNAANHACLQLKAIEECLTSDQSINQLSLTTYDKMRLNIRATEKYLILRVLEKMHVLLIGGDYPLSAPVQDHAGNVVTFSLHNFFCPRPASDPEGALPIGTIFILNEPLVKTTSLGGWRLLCHSPSDLVVVGRDHPWWEWVKGFPWSQQVVDGRILANFNGKTAEEWKKRGKELFRGKNFAEAWEAYRVALKMAEKEESDGGEVMGMLATLHLGLAAICLALEYFEKTIQHCSFALSKISQNCKAKKKALYRAGRAHYELRQFQEATKVFDVLVDIQPDDSAKEHLEKCKARLEEAKNGVNIYQLYLSAKLERSGTLPVKFIPKDSEITVQCHDVTSTNFIERQQHYMKLGVVCDCELCEMDAAEPMPVQMERKRLVDLAVELMNERSLSKQPVVERVVKYKEHLELLKQIRESYGRRTKWQVALFQPYLEQAQLDYISKSPKKCLETVTKAYACVGINMEKIWGAAANGRNDIFDDDAIVAVDFSVLVAQLKSADAYFDTLPIVQRGLLGLEMIMRVLYGSDRAVVKEEFDLPANIYQGF